MSSLRTVLLSGCCALTLLSAPAFSETIPLDTQRGSELLAEALATGGAVGFGAMSRFREPQRLQTYCGVASSIDVLNSLGVESEVPSPDIYPYNQINQYTFFTNAVLKIKVPVKVQGEGIELDKLAQMLGTFKGITAVSYHAGAYTWIQQTTGNFLYSVGLGTQLPQLTGLDETRTRITAALKDPNSRVIINFHRKALGQAGGGHFSPLAAYDPKNDSVLIFDTAAYKLPPVWVTITELWNAMATVDSDGAGPGLPANRGFVVITKK